MSSKTLERHSAATDWFWYLGVPLAGVVLWLLYGQLVPFSELITGLLPVTRTSHTGEAIAFFVYDVPKVLFSDGDCLCDGCVAQLVQP